MARRRTLAAAALLVALAGTSSPAESAPQVHSPILHTAAERTRCLAASGTVVYPDSHVAACQLPSPNEGRTCRDAADCAGSSCVPVKGAASQAKGRSLGRCSRVPYCGGTLVVDGDIVSQPCTLH